MRINVLDYFAETAAKFGNKPAVIGNGEQLEFSALEIRAKKLSLIIGERTCDTIRKPIAVFIEKSIDAVVSDVAIIFSGNAYMNLDVKTPEQRIRGILELIQPEMVITNRKYGEIVSNCWNAEKTIYIDEIKFDEVECSHEMVALKQARIIDTDPLCIINTSGSTGVPKGVVLNHRSFIDFTEWAIETTGIGEGEIIGSLSPLVFDIYSFELCMLLAQGSTIVLIPDSLSAFPVKILQLLQNHKVTYIFWVPTIMVNIANMDLLSKIALEELKLIWFAGEVFPTKQFNYWRRSLPQVQFINLYGPIEITLDCTYYIVNRELADDEPIPIGIACKNTDILILNEKNELCSAGEEGELCVRGSSLAMGYYNNPEKTALAFVQNPLNKAYPEIIYRTGDVVCVNDLGEVIFRGRKDTLVKHSGYRIELGEIEHVIINVLKIVRNGCVVYDGFRKEIVLFYEAGENTTVADIRKAASVCLPKYMIPTEYKRMNELPRNTNGKIDRLRLRESLNE